MQKLTRLLLLKWTSGYTFQRNNRLRIGNSRGQKHHSESNPKSMNSSAKGCNSPLTISGLSLEGCPFRHGQATVRSIPKGLRCGLGILVPVTCQVPHLTVSQPGKSFITPVVVPGGHSKKKYAGKTSWGKPRTIGKQAVISFNCLKGFKLCRRS